MIPLTQRQLHRAFEALGLASVDFANEEQYRKYRLQVRGWLGVV